MGCLDDCRFPQNDEFSVWMVMVLVTIADEFVYFKTAKELKQHFLLSGDADGFILLWEFSLSQKKVELAVSLSFTIQNFFCKRFMGYDNPQHTVSWLLLMQNWNSLTIFLKVLSGKLPSLQYCTEVDCSAQIICTILIFELLAYFDSGDVYYKYLSHIRKVLHA